MKFILAPDSFKGSLSAKQVCIAMEKGIMKVFPDAEVISLPLADGGEGTVETLIKIQHIQGSNLIYKIGASFVEPDTILKAKIRQITESASSFA